MLRRLLSAASLLLLLTSSAQASPINLLLTTDHYAPIFGPPEISINFRFFDSATNGWLSFQTPQTELASGGAALLPGVTQFNVSLDAESLDNVYFTAHGFYSVRPGPFTSLYVAEPPTGPVPDQLVHTFGPPWIPLANLRVGFSGDFRYVNGESRGPIGTWALAAAPTPLAPVPEPASLLLLGSGLAAIAAKKYRQSKQDVQ